MIITEEQVKAAQESVQNTITGYDVGVTLDKKFVVITYKNADGKPVIQQKLSDKEARYLARELNNARSHLRV